MAQLILDSLLFGQQQKGGPGSGMPTNDRKGKSKAIDNGEQDFLALDIDGDRGESGRGGEGYQQMQLVEQQVSSFLCFP
jgi:syntaxin 5